MISVSPSGRCSGRRGTRTHNPVWGAPLATGLLASSLAFPLQWSHRESHPDLRHARAVSSCWTMTPCRDRSQWTRRESNPDLRLAKAASSRWTMGPSVVSGPPGSRTRGEPLWGRSCVQGRRLAVGPAAPILEPEVRSGLEPEPPPYHGGVPPITAADRSSTVVPAGLEPALSCL